MLYEDSKKGRYIQYLPRLPELTDHSMNLEPSTSPSSTPSTPVITDTPRQSWGHSRSWSTGVTAYKNHLFPNPNNPDPLV